jgi:hypothetical protein
VIHLATAQELGEELNTLLTCDDRMAAAAKQLLQDCSALLTG